MKEEKQSAEKEQRLVHASLFQPDSVPLIWLPNEWDGRTLSIVR